MTEQSNKSPVLARLRGMGHYLIQLAEDNSDPIDTLEAAAIPLPDPGNGLHGVDDREKLRRLAHREYVERMRRTDFFDQAILREPAWDILLDLFIAKIAGLSISISSSCIASHVPTTTALRWLEVLENRGWIVRRSDVKDGRRTWVELSEDAFDRMTRYFREKGARSAAGLTEFSFATPIRRRS